MGDWRLSLATLMEAALGYQEQSTNVSLSDEEATLLSDAHQFAEAAMQAVGAAPASKV
jgi:hypothetical protein